MQPDATTSPSFVIKPAQLSALNYLPSDHPRPVQVEWINRGTDQKLRPTSVDMLLRTLFRDVLSPSVVKLHRSAGLRAQFRTDRERDSFASAFAAAWDSECTNREHRVTAMFADRDSAERAIVALKQAGIPVAAISLLWRASQFINTDVEWREGHSKLSVAGAVATSSIAGAMLGVAVLAIPGVGPAVVAGALVSAALPSVAGVSAAIGATGGAIARMISDPDVDDVSDNFYLQQIRRGKIFVSVDMRMPSAQRDEIRRVFREFGGHTSPRN